MGNMSYTPGGTGQNWTKWPSSVFSRTAKNNEPKPFGPFGVHGSLIMPNHAPMNGSTWDELGWCNLMFYMSPNWLLGPWDRLVCGLAAFFADFFGTNRPGPLGGLSQRSHQEPPKSPIPIRPSQPNSFITWSRKVSIWMPKEGLWTSPSLGAQGSGGRFFLFFFLDHPGGFKVIVYIYNWSTISVLPCYCMLLPRVIWLWLYTMFLPKLHSLNIP